MPAEHMDFSDLRAIFINCTLKRSPELSHTQGLIDISGVDELHLDALTGRRHPMNSPWCVAVAFTRATD